MTFNGRQNLKRVRGAWALISSEPEADATISLEFTIGKHAGMDQYFVSLRTTCCCTPT